MFQFPILLLDSSLHLTTPKLKPYQTTAITNAAKLIQDRDEAKKHPFDANPSTTVQELVQELNINSRP